MLRRFSIRQVIVGALAALALVAVGAIVILLITAASSRHALELQSERLLADRGTADRMIQHVQAQLSAAHYYIDDGDQRHLDRFTAEGIAAYDQLRVYRRRQLTSAERRLVERIRERHEALEVDAQRVFAARTDAPGEALSRELPGADSLRADLNALLDLRRSENERLIEAQRTTWRWIYIACAALGLTFAVVLAITAAFLRRRLLEPLGALSSAVARVGAGDFDARVGVSGGDELATLGHSFNAMATRLRAAREDADRSEARFRSLIENAQDGVLILAADGSIIYQSPAVERILGHPANDTTGTRPFDLIHPDDQEEIAAAFAALETGTAEAVEFRCRHADGSYRVMHATGANMLDDPFVGGYVINISDTTMHRQLEAQLQHAQKMEAVGRLAGGIAHDFNNLLTAIQGYTDLLGDRAGLDGSSQDDVHEIRSAVERAARLTRQLLAFSRRQVVRPRPTDVGAVVGEIEQMLRRLITEDIPLTTEIGPDCWVNIDPGQLEQVVVNLVVNARDAAPDSGISVRVSPGENDSPAARAAGITAGDYVELMVEDDGSGIEPDVVPFIFEPFFTTKDVGKGTGLGLSTVYGIVQETGGMIRVDTEPGRGTRVHVFMPRITAPVTLPRAMAANAPVRTGSELILLVEDEPAVRSLAERVLRRAGYEVIAAENGVDALARLQETGAVIDLLVTDVVMPAMGGVQLATRLLQERPDLRVLFMSGYAADTLPARDAAGRPLHFLEKPFSPAAFAEAVRAVLDEAFQRT